MRLPLHSERDEMPWAMFHENSKNRASSRSTGHQRTEHVQFVQPLLTDCYPLPSELLMTGSFRAAAERRESAYDWMPNLLRLNALGTALAYAYGLRKGFEDVPRRRIPSAGALFPLEVFVYSHTVAKVPSGILYYDSEKHQLRMVRAVEQPEVLECFIQREIVAAAPALVFFCVVPERSTAKYGDRGYRYALIEAGHAAQNLCLAASSLQVNSLCIGGFLDHQLDRLLGLDGISASCVYVCALGEARASIDP